MEIDATVAAVDGEYELEAETFVMHSGLGMKWNPGQITRPWSRLSVRGRLVRVPVAPETPPIPAPGRRPRGPAAAPARTARDARSERGGDARARERIAPMSESLTAETIRITGHDGDEVEAYLARPAGDGARGGVVVIHHMPGYDRATKEIVRRFADLGYDAICPNLYSREAPGAAPDDAAATARANGGVPDDRLVGDVGGAPRHCARCRPPTARSA